MTITKKKRLRVAVAMALAPFAVLVASCSGSGEDLTSGVPTPSAVPAGAVAVVGDSQITKEEFESALKSGLSGFDPLSPTTAAPEPLDPPKFQRCVAAITARAGTDENLKGLSRATFLDSCRERYDQLRSLTLSRLIQDRWIETEANLEGLTVSKQEADAFIEQIRSSWASSPAASRKKFRQAVEASGITPEELRQRAEVAVARQQLGPLAAGEGEPPSPKEAQAAAKERFDAWRSKTLCAESLLVPECSNGPDAT